MIATGTKSITADTSPVLISVDLRSVSIDAINRALYWLADEFAIQSQFRPSDAPTHVDLSVTISEGDEVTAITKRIERALRDFAIRERIEAQTHTVRNEIVGAALRAISRG